MYGKDCMFIYNEIRLDFVITKLNVSVNVKNENFNSSLTNPLSSDYQKFKERFLKEMEPVYKRTLPRFTEIRVVSFGPGSIVVDHEVLLKVDYRNYSEETMEAENLLRATLWGLECSSEENDMLCFNVSKATVSRKDIRVPDLCLEEESIPENLRPYFFGVNTSKALLCVTQCSVRHHSPISCNSGQCMVSAPGPQCYCDTSDQYWYTGDRCQTSISKPGVYGGVTVGLIVLVIIIVILVVILCRRRRKLNKDQLVNTDPQWHEFGWERDYKVQGRLRNPERDSRMIGPHEAFRTTLENVNPTAKLSLPRPSLAV